MTLMGEAAAANMRAKVVAPATRVSTPDTRRWQTVQRSQGHDQQHRLDDQMLTHSDKYSDRRGTINNTDTKIGS